MFYIQATCGKTVGAVADSLVYAIKLLGSQHVGLGSDWDGCVNVPPGLDAAGVAQITQARERATVTASPIKKCKSLCGLVPGDLFVYNAS